MPAKNKLAPKKRRSKITTKPHQEEQQLETLYFFQPISPTTSNNAHTQTIQRFKAVKIGSSQSSKPLARTQTPWATTPQPDEMLDSLQTKNNASYKNLIRTHQRLDRYNLLNTQNHTPQKEDEEIAIASLLQLANATS